MTDGRIDAAVAALGPGPLTEAGLQAHVAPLFSRVRAAFADRIYLANHSLGRPLDATEDDVREGLAAWYAQMGGAWEAWMAEAGAFRARLARLLHAPRPDCVVPKGSAGAGLRAILNTYDGVPRVVATRGEFDSLDVILREYARRGRLALTLVEPRADGLFASADVAAAIGGGVDLVVLSTVVFNSGQRLPDVPDLVRAAHAAGGRVLLDVYHSLGVHPVDVAALDADFAVGGSYKYLRGGPGACFLYLHPRHLDGSLRTLDTGWFAKRDPFTYARPDPPEYGEGGDAFLESTPPVLPFFQARAGQVLGLALDVARLRDYSLGQQRRLVDLLSGRGVPALGGTEDRGAFVTVVDPQAVAWSDALRGRGVITDARGPYLRLCPDVLTTDRELVAAADAVAAVVG
ncbi:MAG: aminotransferase class V-fold PLP-dependent enzyme [Burkholderiales bacterium]